MNIFKNKTYLIILTLIFLSGCEQNKLKSSQGYLNANGLNVWYKIVGTGNKTPLLLLHGGPGVPSYYLNPLEALGTERPIIFYDQSGCGRSEKIIDTSQMSVEHFVDELYKLKNTLGLKEFYLYGQSWGTMLAVDYYLKHPEGIKALILSSPALSIPRWLSDADTLIATLHDSIQKAIQVNEENKTYDNPHYQHALKVYYENFLARKLPWSSDIDSAFLTMGQNVYTYMGGPSEFTMTGPLKDYDRTDRLNEITVPTLFITGEFDEAREVTVRYYQSLVKDADFQLIKNAAHLTTQDNPDENIRVINEFLNKIEN